MEFIIGIDDAGRGPVLGPMVLAGVLIERRYEEKLKEWGATDSKKLSAEKRGEIERKIVSEFKYHVELTSADEIDSRNKIGTNLNTIEAIKAANIINALIEGVEEKVKVIIDCPSTNRENWKNVVKSYVLNPEKVEFFVEHKADANHVVCGAASIVAKVRRDREMKKLKEDLGIELGSGYCSDPVTCEFLDKHSKDFEDKGIIRKSWDTWDGVLKKREQKKLFSS